MVKTEPAATFKFKSRYAKDINLFTRTSTKKKKKKVNISCQRWLFVPSLRFIIYTREDASKQFCYYILFMIPWYWILYRCNRNMDSPNGFFRPRYRESTVHVPSFVYLQFYLSTIHWRYLGAKKPLYSHYIYIEFSAKVPVSLCQDIVNEP